MKFFFMVFLGCLLLTNVFGMKKQVKEQEYHKKSLKLLQENWLPSLSESDEIDIYKIDMAFVAAYYGEFAVLKHILLHSPERIKLIDPTSGENLLHFITRARYFLFTQNRANPKEKLKETRDMINFLISKGLNINLLNVSEETPLDNLAGKCDSWAIDLVNFLKSKGTKTYKELEQETK